MKTIGIIGGSGLYRLEEFEYIKENPANRMSSQVMTEKISALGWKHGRNYRTILKIIYENNWDYWW